MDSQEIFPDAPHGNCKSPRCFPDINDAHMIHKWSIVVPGASFDLEM